MANKKQVMVPFVQNWLYDEWDTSVMRRLHHFHFGQAVDILDKSMLVGNPHLLPVVKQLGVPAPTPAFLCHHVLTCEDRLEESQVIEPVIVSSEGLSEQLG